MPASPSSCSTTSRPASPPHCRSRCCRSSATPATQKLVAELIADHEVDAIIHFAASIVVPDSVRDPLGYYRNNTMNSRELIEAAVKNGVKHFIFSSTAAVYGNPASVPVAEDDPTAPISPYGTSKLMTEIMLRDAARRAWARHVILRYFNVAGADPKLRTGQSTPAPRISSRSPCEAALGRRGRIDVFGTDYPTPDGTCIRDYIHVSDLARAHLAALRICARGGDSVDLQLRLWPRLFGARSDRRGAPRRGPRLPGRISASAGPATSWCRSPPPTASARCSAGRRNSTISTPSSRHALAWERLLHGGPPQRERRCAAPPYSA